MGLTPALSESTACCKENTKNQHYACLTLSYASWYRLQREFSRTMETSSIWVFNICSKYSSLFCTHKLNIWLNWISVKVEERYKWHKWQKIQSNWEVEDQHHKLIHKYRSCSNWQRKNSSMETAHVRSG